MNVCEPVLKLVETRLSVNHRLSYCIYLMYGVPLVLATGGPPAALLQIIIESIVGVA